MKKAFTWVVMVSLLAFLCVWVPGARPSLAQEDDVQAGDGTESIAQTAYPYLDDEGYYHYQICLDGKILPLEHDALLRTKDNKHNELLYPFSEILDYFGVAYYWDRETDDFSTVINGVRVSRDCGDDDFMWFSNQTDGYGNGMIPGAIDGVFYAPNYSLEHTIGAKLTKIAKGDEMKISSIDVKTSKAYSWGAGSDTAAVMRWDGKRYTGSAGDDANAAVSSGSGGSGSGGKGSATCPACGGTGRITCSACGGSGMAWNNQMVWDPITGTMKTQTVRTTCWSCGGTRSRVCGTCGGDGRIN